MKDQQYSLKAEARFRWQESDGTWREGVGTTRNVSRFGVFVSTTSLPAPGSRVQVIITFPSGDMDRLCGQLFGKGVAVRTEPSGFGAEVLFQPGWASVLADSRPAAELDESYPSASPDLPVWVSPAAYQGVQAAV